MSVKILTDSSAYLSEQLNDELDISTVSINVTIQNISKREVEFDHDEFYDLLKMTTEIPTSSQPSLEEMYVAFEKLVKEKHDVVAIFISSKLSGTYSSAHLVRDMILENYPDASITILDSKTTAMEQGVMVIQAARKARENGSLEEVLQTFHNVQEKSRFLFAPLTLEYLKKGGRIGKASSLFGTILQIKPILTVENAEVTVFKKVRTKKKIAEAFLEQLAIDHEKNPISEIVIHHIQNLEDAHDLQDRLKKLYTCHISIHAIGPVVGIHVGPGSIGIVYY